MFKVKNSKGIEKYIFADLSLIVTQYPVNMPTSIASPNIEWN